MTIPTASPADLIAFAIDRGICVLADYNRSEAVLAPHSIEERHGEIYVKAVTLETDGRVPKVLKLGTFKLAGLTNIRLSGQSFAADTLFAEVEAVRQRIAKGPRKRAAGRA
jgi:hypothetical protein